MTAPRPPQTPPPPLSDLAAFARPAPGYRLAFVSIPALLANGLATAVPSTYHSSPPRSFAQRDFRRPFLSEDELARINAFKALKKQVEWMAGRFAAKALARDVLAKHPEPEDLQVGYRPKGAPYLTAAPSLSLSLSHSCDYAVAGLGLTPDRVLGVDVEAIRPAGRRLLLKTAFSAREATRLQHQDDATLFKCWTAKEAFLKYIGQGFHENLKQVEIVNDSIYHHGRPVTDAALVSHLPIPGYAFSMVWRRTGSG